jgi:very-short-patch-repair endonuclease
MTTNARTLRGNLTDAETLLWRKLRRDSLGFSFRRQHPIGRYILDFYCPIAKLAIELDGGQHAGAQHAARDRKRDAYLIGLGITTIRIWNNDVMSNTDGVLQHIRDTLMMHTTPSRREGRADLPLAGGGEGASSQ